MKNHQDLRSALRLSAVASALLTIYGGAQAQDASDEIVRLSRPESTIQFGLGYVDNDNLRYGMFRGLQQSGAYGILNLDVVGREDQTGTIYKVRGRNLGLDTRELRFDHFRQGQWAYFVDYSETLRNQQYVINTGLQGIGTNSLTVAANNPANRRDVSLEIKREKTSLGYSRSLGGGFDAQVRYAHEEKDGTRLFGQGNAAAAIFFLAEPIDTTTQQFDASIGYTGEQLQMQGGYYGSVFNNHLSSLNVAGGTGLQPIALPPGNEAHQVFLTGAYEFARTTRGTFKVAHSKARQNDRFIGLPAGQNNISGRTDLGGEVDTTLVNVGLSSRPLPKLSVAATLRYEDRDDQTPEAVYNTAAATNTHDGRNEVRSFRVTTGKLDAGYQLPAGYRAVASAEHETKERSVSPVRVVSQREKTEEGTVRIGLNKLMSETLNGGVSLAHSDRDGSDFLISRLNNGTVGSNRIAPLHMADRKRDKIKLSADWTPAEAFGLQMVYEESWDEYTTRAASGQGIRDGRGQLYSLDANYAFAMDWQLNAWASHSNTETGQWGGLETAGAANTVFEAGLKDRSSALGVGLKGKLLRKVEVGADLQHSRSRSEFGLVKLNSGNQSVSSLPDVLYETTMLRMFGRYPLNHSAGVQVDVVHDRTTTDDWTWRATSLFADGTTIRQDGVQKTNFIGVSGYYKWW